MKKLNLLFLLILFFSVIFITNCDRNKISNTDHEDTTSWGDEGENSGTHEEVVVSYVTTILDGDTDVEVNKPFQISFKGDIDNTTVTSQTFYLKNSSGNIVPSRIIKNTPEFTLIPRIPLHPGRTYQVQMENIENIKGVRLKTIIISYTNRDLDFGLYWYGKNGLCEKYFPGFENAFYDDEKRTVIFAHGLETGKVKQVDPYGRKGFNHESFYFQEDNFQGAKEYNGIRTYINHSWIDDGWNTGILFWTQFADGVNIWGVETKIWSFDGPSGAKYNYFKENGWTEYREWNRLLDFKGQTIEIKSITHLLGVYLIDALKNNISGSLRLVGHSYGNQIACTLSKECFENNIFVERVALLDPAWTAYGKDYLGDQDNDGKKDWVGERCRKILFEAIEREGDRFAVEIYHTTLLKNSLPGIDDNAPLTQKVCDVDLLPWYYGTAQIESKHVAAYVNYFWSYASPPPIQCITNISGVCETMGIGPSASTPDERIVEMMNEEYKWKQLGGIYTPDPVDDTFEKIKK